MPPRISVALPVRNGAKFIERALDSLLGQECADFELIICDNASDDGTSEICRRYASSDQRIRFFRNERDIGQIPNFNRSFGYATGDYFRWVGVDDSYAPQMLSRCAEALDENADAVAVMCSEKHADDAGNTEEFAHSVVSVDSSRRSQRFHRLLWFYELFRGYNVDPIYSMIRRTALLRTQLFRSVYRPHIVLAAELALIGPFVHIEDELVYRRKRFWIGSTRDDVMRVYDPGRPHGDNTIPKIEWEERAVLLDIVRSSGLGRCERYCCACDVWRHWLSVTRRRLSGRVMGMAARCLRGVGMVRP